MTCIHVVFMELSRQTQIKVVRVPVTRNRQGKELLGLHFPTTRLNNYLYVNVIKIAKL